MRAYACSVCVCVVLTHGKLRKYPRLLFLLLGQITSFQIMTWYTVSGGCEIAEQEWYIFHRVMNFSTFFYFYIHHLFPLVLVFCFKVLNARGTGLRGTRVRIYNLLKMVHKYRFIFTLRQNVGTRAMPPRNIIRIRLNIHLFFF